MTSIVTLHSTGGSSEIIVQPGSPITADERTVLLVDDLYQIVDALNQSVSANDTRTVVDVRVPRDSPGPARVNISAFIAGIKGTIQALTLELPVGSPTVNLVISEDGQEADRDRTKQYLQSDDGGYSLGTTYDLRRQYA